MKTSFLLYLMPSALQEMAPVAWIVICFNFSIFYGRGGFLFEERIMFYVDIGVGLLALGDVHLQKVWVQNLWVAEVHNFIE